MTLHPQHLSSFIPDRGQTAVDFLAGMTVFLVTVGFVFTLVPGMFQPFETDTGANMLAADRSAALLAEDLLLEGVGETGVVNETCAAEFFDGDGLVGDCRFDADAADLRGALRVPDHVNVNVTLESVGVVQTVDGSGGPVTARAGRSPPSTSDVVVAQRIVLVEDERLTLFVRMW